MKSRVEGQENFKSLTRKNAGNSFLVLVPRIERIPSGFGGVGRFHRIWGSAARYRPRSFQANPLGGPLRRTSTLCLHLKLGSRSYVYPSCWRGGPFSAPEILPRQRQS